MSGEKRIERGNERRKMVPGQEKLEGPVPVTSTKLVLRR